MPEPLFVVQEELPVADNCTPDQQKRHGWCEWSKVRVVYRRPIVALVKGSHPQLIVHIGWNANLLQETTKEVLGLSRQQISENNHDRFVVRVVAVDGLSA